MCKSTKVWVTTNNSNTNSGMDLDGKLEIQDKQMDDPVIDMSVKQKTDNVVIGERVPDLNKESQEKECSYNVEMSIDKNNEVVISDQPKVVNSSNGCMQENNDKRNLSFENLNNPEVQFVTENHLENCSDDLYSDDAAAIEALMDESDSSTSSLKRRRVKFKTGGLKGKGNLVCNEPLVETNPEWVKLISQYQTRSKAKKVKNERGLNSSVICGGISKK